MFSWIHQGPISDQKFVNNIECKDLHIHQTFPFISLKPSRLLRNLHFLTIGQFALVFRPTSTLVTRDGPTIVTRRLFGFRPLRNFSLLDCISGHSPEILLYPAQRGAVREHPGNLAEREKRFFAPAEQARFLLIFGNSSARLSLMSR